MNTEKKAKAGDKIEELAKEFAFMEYDGSFNEFENREVQPTQSQWIRAIISYLNEV